jgi:hypothetical protein
MNKYFFLLLLLPILVFGQQLNHSWGYTTAGVAYTQTGYPDADSTTTINIIFDLQDWYPLDWNPLVLDVQAALDSSETAHGLSAYTFLGTFWYRIDAAGANDSTTYQVLSYPGNMIYYSGSGNRITATNLNFSTTATTLVSTTTSKGDIQWSFVNVYVNSSADKNSITVKHLPPEFLKISIPFNTQADDLIDVYWDFVYPSVYQREQSYRSTTNQGNVKKAAETLH